MKVNEDLYRNIITINPMIHEDDIEEVIQVGEYDLLIKFKNGTKRLHDGFTNRYRLIQYENDDLTEEQWKFEFRTRLYQMMIRNGFSQKRLAEKIGVSEVMISRYITGECIPNSIMLHKLAKALHCSMDDFVYKHY